MPGRCVCLTNQSISLCIVWTKYTYIHTYVDMYVCACNMWRKYLPLVVQKRHLQIFALWHSENMRECTYVYATAHEQCRRLHWVEKQKQQTGAFATPTYTAMLPYLSALVYSPRRKCRYHRWTHVPETVLRASCSHSLRIPLNAASPSRQQTQPQTFHPSDDPVMLRLRL